MTLPKRPSGPKAKRVKIAPSLAPETIDGLDEIAAQTGESRGQLIDRLVVLELRRIRRQQQG